MFYGRYVIFLKCFVANIRWNIDIIIDINYFIKNHIDFIIEYIDTKIEITNYLENYRYK